MWLMKYITKNSIAAPSAVKGSVNGNHAGGSCVTSSKQHKRLKICAPYGIYSVPPVGESAVVLPLEDGEIMLGSVSRSSEIEEGELMLRSKGGATLLLKNDGTVLINGKEYT